MSPMKMDLTPDTLDLVLYAGDRGDFQLEFIDDNSQKIDVSTWVWTAQIRGSRDSESFIDLTIDMTDALTGLITVRIPSTVTRSLVSSGDNSISYWDVQCIRGGGDPITVLQGTINCSQDVTR